MTRQQDERFLIDEVLPEYDVSARYSVRIEATPERVYSVLQRPFPVGAVTRLLLKIRDIPRMLRHGPSAAGSLTQTPFMKLKQLENREIVVGIIGQFWKPAPEPVAFETLEEFLSFRKEGYCKAAMTLRIQPANSGCLVTTETRVIGYGEKARTRFREYWGLIGPFSGLIRKEMLRKIRKEAERNARR